MEKLIGLPYDEFVQIKIYIYTSQQVISINKLSQATEHTVTIIKTRPQLEHTIYTTKYTSIQIQISKKLKEEIKSRYLLG